MSKAKPFLFGSLLGASIMFVAMQYHVVRSHDGFQVVPRTPQASLGLAYADIREWDATKWTDRPELARALMAHGSADLISQSVVENLTDTVSTESATLDQLRSLINGKTDGADSATDARLFKLPDFEPLKPDASNENSIVIPFPQDAKRPLPDPFKVAQSGSDQSTSERSTSVQSGADRANAAGTDTSSRTINSDSSKGSRFGVDDILNTGTQFFTEDVSPPARTFSGDTSRNSVPSVSPTQKIAERLESTIFGSGPGSTSGEVPTSSSRAPVSPFEDISAELESRARSALNRAETSLGETGSKAMESITSDSGQFIRDRLPDSVRSAFPATPSTSGRSGNSAGAGSMLSEDTLRSLREKFDPFVD
ncbi:MAG: hypothetical protein R3C20_15070 [Planctomycetaceae bacterium]